MCHGQWHNAMRTRLRDSSGSLLQNESFLVAAGQAAPCLDGEADAFEDPVQQGTGLGCLGGNTLLRAGLAVIPEQAQQQLPLRG